MSDLNRAQEALSIHLWGIQPGFAWAADEKSATNSIQQWQHSKQRPVLSRTLWDPSDPFWRRWRHRFPGFWLVENIRQNLRKNLGKMETSDWLLKIVGRESNDIRSKNSPKISLCWRMGPFRPQFSEDDVTESWLLISGEDLRKIFGKRRQGFGNGRQGKRKKKRGGVGEGRQEEKKRGGVGEGKRKKEGRGGWGKARKYQGGAGGWSKKKINKK